MEVLKIVDHSLSEVALVEESSGYEKPMEAYIRRRGCGKGIWSSEGKWNLEGEGLVARVEISLSLPWKTAPDPTPWTDPGRRVNSSLSSTTSI